jgi:predicted transcriptional regulator
MMKRLAHTKGGGGALAVLWALASNPWMTVVDLCECLGLSRSAVESALRTCIRRDLVAVDYQAKDLGLAGRHPVRCFALTNCRFADSSQPDCVLTAQQICEILAESPDMTAREISDLIGKTRECVRLALVKLIREGRVIGEMDQRALIDKNGRNFLKTVKIYSLKGMPL